MAKDDDFQPEDDDDDEQPFTSYFQEEANKHQAEADTAADVAADVLQNARYDEFFAPYQPRFRESFAHHYVLARQAWISVGQANEDQPNRRLLIHAKDAYVALWAIQQKKLFDLQCRWRAEELTDVPGVVISDDFGTLSAAIENCAPLPAITAEEFALYLEWVRQADYARDLDDRNDGCFVWQNHRFIREALAPDAPPLIARVQPVLKKTVSDWYRFHNARTGHDRLLYLPDHRGAKEERYWNAWREQQREQEAIARAVGTAPDPRPLYLPPEEQEALATEFARHFESARLNRWRETKELLRPRQTEEDRRMDLMANFLLSNPEPVPVAAAADWREATRQAYYAYCHRQLLEQLPVVYDEYLQRQSWGITQPNRLDWELSKYDLARYYRGWLLAGRARLGEPEDFNF
ncbi:hypothetical protein GCM10022408_22140 [Hymenobacter fastidiosus]|uniref:Uncharacterized protein n=1 Tax=Hymenobacter fastidiosus TaxID=486264 RepID=A0ABP7SC67_9BACT